VNDLTDDMCSEPILEHVYSARPPLAETLLSQYLAYPLPRPSLLYLPDASPPTTVYSISHAPLLILCPSRSDAQPFAVLEFLHRVIDVFEDFLGAPLLSAKIESNYDVVAQLLSEMCDGGIICNTEANALRENVEVSGVIGKLFTQVGLPGYVPRTRHLLPFTCPYARIVQPQL
jgi:AP-3 complex subunit mu